MKTTELEIPKVPTDRGRIFDMTEPIIRLEQMDAAEYERVVGEWAYSYLKGSKDYYDVVLMGGSSDSGRDLVAYLDDTYNRYAISKSVIDVKQKELCHKAFLAEKRKIQVLMADLRATLENAENNKINIETENDKLLEDINRLVNDMNESLRPVIDSKLEEISGLLEKRELWNIMHANDSKIKKYEDRISELESSKEKVTNKSKGNVKDISEEKLEQFSEIVKKMLVSWNFIEQKSNVVFDEQNKDLCVDGKRKELFGKGARAIINSAFLIGLMQYCYDNRLCHPGVIILDTPLTTFREKDAAKNEKDESVGKDIKMAVYEKLATACKDYQIIIFENEEPTKDLKSNINYIHFSGNANVDRKGFIPE